MILFRVLEGTISNRQSIRMFSTTKNFEVTRLGVFSPEPQDIKTLGPGEVGFLCASIKDLDEARVGDTITDAKIQHCNRFPASKKSSPWFSVGSIP